MDQFFPAASGYRKLVVHFTINDLTFAERSVDSRMAKEMADGAAALLDSNVAATIEANAGGPYGSAALANVQEASENVWASVLDGALVCHILSTLLLPLHDRKLWSMQKPLLGPVVHSV